MGSRIFGIEFEGYWREEHEDEVPAMSGVFCVYSCVDHPQSQAVELGALLYIGEADDVRHCIASDEHVKLWRSHLKPGEDLCFSFGRVAPEDRARCQAALVQHHRPPVNERLAGGFPFGDTTLSVCGRINHLHASFTVARGAT